MNPCDRGSLRSLAVVFNPETEWRASRATWPRPVSVAAYEFTLGYKRLYWFLMMFMLLNFTYPLHLQALCQSLLALLRQMESGNPDQEQEFALFKRNGVCVCAWVSVYAKQQRPSPCRHWCSCLSVGLPRDPNLLWGTVVDNFKIVHIISTYVSVSHLLLISCVCFLIWPPRWGSHVLRLGPAAILTLRGRLIFGTSAGFSGCAQHYKYPCSLAPAAHTG